MKIGHLLLTTTPGPAAEQFISLVLKLDRLDIEQHVIAGDEDILRQLCACPGVDRTAAVRSPVEANSLMPPVDLVHAHDAGGARAALLLTLTRSIPYVLTAGDDAAAPGPGELAAAISGRARAIFDSTNVDTATLLGTYRRAAAAASELPENTDGG